MSAKPLRVAVIASDGTLLGYVNRKPINANWRILGRVPRVPLTRKTPARDCTWREHHWTVRLADGELPPADMEAP